MDQKKHLFPCRFPVWSLGLTEYRQYLSLHYCAQTLEKLETLSVKTSNYKQLSQSLPSKPKILSYFFLFFHLTIPRYKCRSFSTSLVVVFKPKGFNSWDKRIWHFCSFLFEYHLSCNKSFVIWKENPSCHNTSNGYCSLNYPMLRQESNWCASCLSSSLKCFHYLRKEVN